MSYVVYEYETDNGDKFRCTANQIETIEKLKTIAKGGIGAVHGYVIESNRVKPEKVDMQFIAAFSTEALYKRKATALESLTYDEVAEFAEQHDKVLALSKEERVAEFERRKQKELDSINTTLSGDRSDNRRKAHDRMYCSVGQGVRVHFHGVKESYADEDGKKKSRTVPDMVAGLPVCKSIILNILEIKREVLEEGEYKKVNSGAGVLIQNAMFKALNLRSIGFKSLSLKEDNFDSLVISRKEILAEDVKGFPSELFERA